jgi:bifunctional UDP-N-acetylglucosamine pyrophosphorylase / glucosamine-1-phosphate N-acetyltransferase
VPFDPEEKRAVRIDPPAAVIVLAAGAGTRMKSARSKALHEIAGRSLVSHALHAAAELAPQHLVAVVGSDREQVEPHVRSLRLPVEVAVQPKPLGTADALRCGLGGLAGLAGEVVVTYGDTPLLTGETLGDLLAAHRAQGNAVTLLTARLPDPTGYGRVLRDAAGEVTAVVEQKDATAPQRAVNEINSGIYVFALPWVHTALEQVRPDNAQGELYLTDVVALARADGKRVGAQLTDDVWQTEGVNDRAQLARLGAELNARLLRRWMLDGVTVVDPAVTWLDVTVRLSADVTLLPGVSLHGETTVATGAVIGPDTTLVDTSVGEEATVIRTHGQGAALGAGVTVGPFAYLRPGTRLGAGGKIGTFVETKNADIAEGAKVPHLSYVGDASIGERTNIGAGTIFANYDGVTKHHTSVGSHCHTGSGNVFVAPVVVGDGASTGAGAVVREDVPPGALAVSSGPQRNIADWVARKRPGTDSDQAAERARHRSPPLEEDLP